MTDGMPDPQHGRPAPGRWTIPQRLCAGILAVLSLGVVAPAFFAIYETVTKLVRPWLHGSAWIVPVSGEVAFMVAFGCGILLAWRKAPDVPVRVAGMTLLAVASVVLNVYAGRDALPDAVAHLVIVAAFFIVTLTGKATITSLRGGKVRAGRVTAGEFLASPLRAVRLWRWMRVWGEPSRTAARHRYTVLLYAIDVARSDPGVGKRPFRWRRKLPAYLRYDLAAGDLGPEIAAAGDNWKKAVREYVRAQLTVPDDAPPSEPEGVPAASPEAPPGPALEATPRARPGARSGSALRLPASKSGGMTPGELEPHVAAMLEEYGEVSQARVKRDLHVGTDKAAEALRLARNSRTVVPISASR
jgi:hypothetical protein